MKKNSIKKMALFSFILTILMLSPMYPAYVVAAPTDIFDAGFDTQVETLMNTAKVESLALSIINGTEVFYETGYGEQPGTDKVYCIVTISSIVAATAILQLMEDGLLDLDDPVNDYLPWLLRNPYYPSTPITILDVLTERTGLATYQEIIEDVMIVDEAPFPDFLNLTINENGLNYSISMWSDIEPGTAWQHCWIHYDIAAYLVELIAGESYEQYVEKNIFTPLGMTNTEFTYTNYTLSQLAKQYIWNTTSGVNEEQDFWDDPGLGSVSIYSTVGDLSRFLIAHMNKGVYNSVRILEETSVELMQTEVAGSAGLFWVDYGRDDYQGYRTYPWIGAASMITKANVGVVAFYNQGFYNYYQKLNDITNYIFAKAKELIPTPPTTPSETSLGFIAIPMMLAFLGIVSIYNRRRNK